MHAYVYTSAGERAACLRLGWRTWYAFGPTMSSSHACINLTKHESAFMDPGGSQAAAERSLVWLHKSRLQLL